MAYRSMPVAMLHETIAIGELLAPTMHALTLVALFLLSGMTFGLAALTIPALTHPTLAESTPIPPQQADFLLAATIARLQRPAERTLALLLPGVSFFSWRHSRASVHARAPHLLIAAALLTLALALDALLLAPLEARIRLLAREDECGAAKVEGGKAAFEARRLLGRWGARQRWRLVLPLAAGIVALMPLLGRL